jgi:hypothetical protein
MSAVCMNGSIQSGEGLREGRLNVNNEELRERERPYPRTHYAVSSRLRHAADDAAEAADESRASASLAVPSFCR